MNLIVALYAGVLFYLLTPNVLLRIPQKGSTKMVAFVHAVVFALLLFLTSKFVWMLSNNISSIFSSKKEGLGQECKSSNDCNGGEVCGPDNTCVAAEKQ